MNNDMNNYVSVGNIIEQERLKRQEQISKGISSDVFDHIEKAHSDDFSQVEVTTDDNLTRFANDISQLNKAETELLLNKLQRQINADSESQLLKSFRSIALSHMDAIEKGVYSDNPLNRKLGRVGQEWHRGKKRNSWEGIADPVERKRVQSFEEQGFSVGEQIRSEKAKAKSSRKDFMRRKHNKKVREAMTLFDDETMNDDAFDAYIDKTFGNKTGQKLRKKILNSNKDFDSKKVAYQEALNKLFNGKKKLKSGGLPEIKYNPEFDNGLPSNKPRRKKPAVPKWMKAVNKITRQ